MRVAIRVAANFDQFLAGRPGLGFRLEQTRQRAPKAFPLIAPNAELLVEAHEINERLRREALLKYGTPGENDGKRVSAAVPTDGMRQLDQPAAPAAEVLLGRMPPERRPRDTRGDAPRQGARAMRPLQGGTEAQGRAAKLILKQLTLES